MKLGRDFFAQSATELASGILGANTRPTERPTLTGVGSTIDTTARAKTSGGKADMDDILESGSRVSTRACAPEAH
jgi:hypothetical protein